ncbi:hypothetical protein CEXT_84921 [Caerostris extrusa]|uniref:Uncharacterized protein n=1 Tax=Caerostris extrusa TaxID=172846 RepID=A0AAV4XQJ2_CAEEX|nr:hypothetical protein CEXT_84921 [Caerostris extrusa]
MLEMRRPKFLQGMPPVGLLVKPNLHKLWKIKVYTPLLMAWLLQGPNHTLSQTTCSGHFRPNTYRRPTFFPPRRMSIGEKLIQFFPLRLFSVYLMITGSVLGEFYTAAVKKYKSSSLRGLHRETAAVIPQPTFPLRDLLLLETDAGSYRQIYLHVVCSIVSFKATAKDRTYIHS